VALWKTALKSLLKKKGSIHNLGYAYLQTETMDEAAKKFEEALQLNPSLCDFDV